MHRTYNNAQNTQQKLGVAFSYLERNILQQIETRTFETSQCGFRKWHSTQTQYWTLLRFYLFADDTNILYADKNLKDLEAIVNNELQNLYNWSVDSQQTNS